MGKKIILIAYIMLVVVGIIGITTKALNSADYTIEAIVVSTQDDEVTIEDRQGNLWTYYTEDKQEQAGDTVIATLNDKDTEDKTDDEIIGVVVR